MNRTFVVHRGYGEVKVEFHTLDAATVAASAAAMNSGEVMRVGYMGTPDKPAGAALFVQLFTVQPSAYDFRAVTVEHALLCKALAAFMSPGVNDSPLGKPPGDLEP